MDARSAVTWFSTDSAGSLRGSPTAGHASESRKSRSERPVNSGTSLMAEGAVLVADNF